MRGNATACLSTPPPNSAAVPAVRAIRAACRHFVDEIDKYENSIPSDDKVYVEYPLQAMLFMSLDNCKLR
jgi:hypothetical protein